VPVFVDEQFLRKSTISVGVALSGTFRHSHQNATEVPRRNAVQNFVYLTAHFDAGKESCSSSCCCAAAAGHELRPLEQGVTFTHAAFFRFWHRVVSSDVSEEPSRPLL
jgi:hypothetical protein